MTSKFPILQWGDDCVSNDYSSECEWTYRMFVGAFGLLVTVLTMREFTEMVFFQVLLTFARFLLITVLLTTSIVGLYTNKIDNSSVHTSTPYTGDYHLWRWTSVVTVLSATVFSQLVNFGLPSILTPLSTKGSSHKLVMMALVGTSTLYCLVGVSATLYWGEELKDQINLNYQKWRGGYHEDHWWSYIVQYFVVLFPALDVISMFPLVATALANSLLAFMLRLSRSARRINRKVRLLCVCICVVYFLSVSVWVFVSLSSFPPSRFPSPSLSPLSPLISYLSHRVIL